MLKKLLFIGWLIFSIAGEQAMANETLTAKQQTIAQSASYAALGNQAGLRQALNDGLDAGVTLDEFKEILVQSYAYCGFPRALNALTTLMQLAPQSDGVAAKNIEPTTSTNSNSLEIGTQNQTKLVGHPVEGELFEFAPAIDKYLKAHLFGDIFSRPAVDWQTRELATIAMLAARDKVSSQLNSHIAIGKHNGLTDAQIAAILDIAGQAKARCVLFGFGKENTAYARYFIGKSYLQPLNSEGVGIANVTFEPKCRNNWHIHHKGGQILMVVSGSGWYQEWGKPAQKLQAGDVVNISPEVKHWHGAAKDSWFTHIAIAVPADDASTEWLEPVTDDEYNLLP